MLDTANEYRQSPCQYAMGNICTSLFSTTQCNNNAPGGLADWMGKPTDFTDEMVKHGLILFRLRYMEILKNSTQNTNTEDRI